MISASIVCGMKIASKFVMEDIVEINPTLMDALGEIINIIAGAAEAKIDDFNMDLALPSILIGKTTQFYAKVGTPFYIVPLYLKGFGDLELAISLEDKK